MRRAVCLAALGAAWLAAGCGQKGPLYLPERNARAATTPAAQPTPAQPTPAQPAPAAPPSASAPQPAPPSTTPTPPAPGKPGDQSDDSGTPK